MISVNKISRFFPIVMILSILTGCSKSEKGAEQKIAKEPGVTRQILAQNFAPDFTVTDLNGKKVSSSEFKGKILILNFWATWCPACRMEIPHLNELQRGYNTQGLTVLGVSLDRDGAKAVRYFQSKVKMDYPVVMGDEKITVDYLGYYNALPTSFIISPDWKIYRKYLGFVPKEKIEKDLAELLKKKS
ncbi:MAG: TlpA family protein disulfide reductase [Candidatus Schekmanbacteria bacterium]|nr:TlpA family protein disulfide reductase [Candidatus Schekmanbacteria bacterium]